MGRGVRWRAGWRQSGGGGYGRAVRGMEAGIDRTCRTDVRAIKRGRAGGKLSEEEIDRAHQQARRFAIRFGRTTGVDVIQELGDDFIDLWMTKLVQRARRNADR